MRKRMCSMRGLNPRPFAYKTKTLPTELMEQCVFQHLTLKCILVPFAMSQDIQFRNVDTRSIQIALWDGFASMCYCANGAVRLKECGFFVFDVWNVSWVCNLPWVIGRWRHIYNTRMQSLLSYCMHCDMVLSEQHMPIVQTHWHQSGVCVWLQVLLQKSKTVVQAQKCSLWFARRCWKIAKSWASVKALCCWTEAVAGYIWQV